MGSAVPAPLPVGRLAGVGLIIFFANAAMLVLQLVAGRLLAPFVGSSLETWTSIIGVFLLGIALGNAFGGKLADRYPSPRTLGLLLALGALTAIWMVAFPMILASSGTYKSIPLGPRIPILAAALCLPAGFVLSLLTPLAIKLGLPDVAHTGRVAGLIFALSTLGCLLGNYLTGFVLLREFTINQLAFGSAGVLGILAIGTFLLLADSSSSTETDDGLHSLSMQPEPRAEAARTTINPHAFPDIRVAYLIVFLASFGGMTLELTASRVLAQYLGVSLFTWTGIIGVMLAGTALGNFTGGLFADRASQPGGMRRPLAVVSAIGTGLCLLVLVYQGVPWLCGGLPFGMSTKGLFILAAAVAIVGGGVVYAAVSRFTDERINPRTMLAVTLIAAGAGTVLLFVTRTILTQSAPFAGWDLISQVIGWTFTLFFLPMFVLGMVSPQVIRLAVPDVAHVGRVAGRVYAWSTAGAIAGTFAAGYVLISKLGMDAALLGVSLLLTVTSLLVARVWENNSMLYLFSVVLGGITGGFILTSRPDSDRGESDEHTKLIARVETNYYTIKVTELLNRAKQPTGRRILTLDALIHSEVDLDNPSFLHYTHEHIQVEMLWMAEADAPNTRTLVVGGGGYTLPRYVMTNIPNAQMDVVEIDPGVTKAAKDYLGLEDYRNLNIVHMDGRQFISERVAPGTYDLVVQDAVNDLSVPSHLLTKEYNDAVKLTLKPNGVYLLTVIEPIKWGRLWRSAMRTLKETFPYVELISAAAPPPESPPPGATDAEVKQWKSDLNQFWNSRHVLVIYASDRPLDEERLRSVVYRNLDIPARAAVTGAPYAAATAAFYSNIIPAHRLQPFFDKDPGLLLTDQFAPVDNLMAEVFRYRYRTRPEDDE